MIRLFSKLFKCFQQNKLNTLSDLDIFNTYIQNINVSNLTCNKCGTKHSLTYLSKYKRHLVVFHNGKVSDSIVEVPRYICKSCGRTHAILPPSIIPYRSYSFSFVVSVLHDYIVKKFNSVEILCQNYSLPYSTFKRFLATFYSHKILWLGLLDSYLESNLKFISKFKFFSYVETEYYISEFFNMFQISFLQQNVKLGVP